MQSYINDVRLQLNMFFLLFLQFNVWVSMYVQTFHINCGFSVLTTDIMLTKDHDLWILEANPGPVCSIQKYNMEIWSFLCANNNNSDGSYI